MPGDLQPLVSNQLIVNPDGTPTQYFIRWAQARQIDISGGINAVQAQQLIDDWAAQRVLTAGVGLSGGGNLSADRTFDLEDTLVAPGSYGDETHSARLLIDQQGRIQAAVEKKIPTPPAGGTANQVLTKNTATDYDFSWKTPAAGGGGGYSLIQRQVLGAASANVTFSAIPNTYEDLILTWVARSNANVIEVEIDLRLNGDAGPVYDGERIHAFDSGTNFSQFIGQTLFLMGYIAANNAPAGIGGLGTLTIPSYARNVFNKGAISTWRDKNGTGGFSQGTGQYSLDWRNTSAINSLLLFPSQGSFIAGSVFSLYGRS